MNEDAVFKRYDVRGKYPEELNEEFAERIGKSLGTFVKRNYSSKVAVTRDTKKSSVSLKNSLIEGLTSTGVDVIDAGVGPTDYTGFVGEKEECVSVQVTSSHMPLEFNGFKFIYPTGNGFVNEDLDQVKQLFRQKDFETGKGEENVRNYEDAYKEAALDYLDKFAEDNEGTVVVETMGGATKDFLPDLLEKIGFNVIDCGEKQESPYIDPPNPKPENLDHLVEKVEKNNAVLGIATDLDADRVAAYWNGRWLTGDEVFCIFSKILQTDVVASVDSSKALEDTVKNYGKEIFYTRVGDPFVSDRMIKEDAGFSGEPNGHYCFPEFSGYNSGTLSALILAVTDLAPLLEDIPEYKVKKANFQVSDKEKAVKKIREHVRDKYNVISDIDGVKFSTGQEDVLVRSSGSSPVVRFKGETQEGDLNHLKEEIENLLKNDLTK